MNEAVKGFVERAKKSGWGKVFERWTATDESKEVHNSSSAVGCTVPYDIIYCVIRIHLEPRVACFEQLAVVGVNPKCPSLHSLTLAHFLDLEFDTGRFFSDGLLHVLGQRKWLELAQSAMFECIECDVWKEKESEGGNFEDLCSVLPKRTVQTLLRSPNERSMLPLHFAFAKYRDINRIPDFEYLKHLLCADHCEEIGARALNFKGKTHELTLFEFAVGLFEYNKDPTDDKLLALSAADRIDKFADTFQLS